MNTALPRDTTPLLAPDLSSFAKALRAQLALRFESGAGVPGHVELLNLLARAAGHRNLQALKAAAARMASSQQAPTAHRWHGPRDPSLSLAADRTLRLFDGHGRLTRWPSRRAEQVLALWCLWMAFDGKRRYSEREVNEVLNAQHGFGDHCLLRREMIELKLLARTPGGAEYRKLAARPDTATAALMRAVRHRAPSSISG